MSKKERERAFYELYLRMGVILETDEYKTIHEKFGAIEACMDIYHSLKESL